VLVWAGLGPSDRNSKIAIASLAMYNALTAGTTQMTGWLSLSKV
jgi:hypothetical protein